jgi:purine nucleoside phosphorylase
VTHSHQAIALANARIAADAFRRRIGIPFEPKLGLVLGTGWGDCLDLTGCPAVPLKDLPGFRWLDQLPNHARTLHAAAVAGVPCAVLRGRVHLNERPLDEDVSAMVRAQTEILLELGATTLILTSGGCAIEPHGRPEPGQICVVNGFTTVFAPPMPLFGNERRHPAMALDGQLIDIAMPALAETGLAGDCGGYAMVRGPFPVWGRYDMGPLAQTGASVAGMSMLPEAAVAAQRPGVKVLGLASVHGERGQRDTLTAKLGAYLRRIISLLP